MTVTLVLDIVIAVLVNVTAKSITKTSENLFFYIILFYLLQSAAVVTAGPVGPKHKHANVVPNSSVSRQEIKAGEAIHGLFAGFTRLQTPKNSKTRYFFTDSYFISYGMVD